MDELQLGLIAAGASIVAGVVGYNAWQEMKLRRKMPRGLPTDSKVAPVPAALCPEDSGLDLKSQAEDSRQKTEARERGGPFSAKGSLAESSGEPFIDPVRAVSPPRDLLIERREPSLGDACASPAENAPKSAPLAGLIRSTLATASTALLGAIDRRIDCIVPVTLSATVASEKALPFVHKLRRAGTKPVLIEARPEGGGDWEKLRAGARYAELRAAVQLANRSGALNELEFSEFAHGVQNLADAVEGLAEFPDMIKTVAMARELDGFAAQCDVQLSLNVRSDGAPWSANYLQAVAAQDSLLLSRDGTRFVKLDAQQHPVFMLQFGDTNFLRDDLTHKGSQTITLLLDVPIADEEILPFRLMCDYAASLSQRIGGRVVDDQHQPLSQPTLAAIEKQLLTLYSKLEAAGMPAGSAVARRLFSH